MKMIKIYHVNINGFWYEKYENFNIFTFLSLHDLSPGETADVFADTYLYRARDYLKPGKKRFSAKINRKYVFFVEKFWFFRSKSYFCLNFGIARMTDEEKKLLSTFETQLRHLIFLHDELRRENAALKQELEAKENECRKVQADFQELGQRYTDLKTATTISLNGSDVRETKIRLSKLVREVDKCIALLNE